MNLPATPRLEKRDAQRSNHMRFGEVRDWTLIRKHVLQLDGLGVRGLHFSGDDLHILAGPPMVLNGDIRGFKYQPCRSHL